MEQEKSLEILDKCIEDLDNMSQEEFDKQWKDKGMDEKHPDDTLVVKAIEGMTVEDYEELYDECKDRGNGEKVFIPCCDDYLPMVGKINNIIELQSIRTGNHNLLGEDYKHFVYCPWCGEKLK